MRRLIIGTVILLLLASVGISFAQSSGGEFEILNSTIDGGGGRSVGGEFSLIGTIGQPDANPTVSSGGEFALAGGF